MGSIRRDPAFGNRSRCPLCGFDASRSMIHGSCSAIRTPRSQAAIMSNNPLSRRDFLQVTTGAGAFASLVPAVARHDTHPPPQPSTDGWFDGPMRWVQLTLVENDPGTFDPQFWLDYF